jgi:hypothetical protein
VTKYYFKAARRLQQIHHDVNARLGVEHVSGPRKLPLGSDDVVVVCLVKNGSYFIDTFLRHYRALGAAHFVFVDNGSTDDTAQKAKAAGDATLVRSSLPFKRYQNELRSIAARRYAMGHWCILADMDELFDFHHADSIGLQGLAQYLDEHGYTCAVGQMLDFFPDSEASFRDPSAADFESISPFYDLSCIESFGYREFPPGGFNFDYFIRHNTMASPAIKWLFGGIRRKLFDANVCLTKHPITRLSRDSNPCSHPHCASNVKCADISVLIRHYKFAGDFRRRVEAEFIGQQFGSRDREHYLAGLQDTRNLRYRQPSSRQYSGTEELLREGFLVTSPAYEKWVTGYVKPTR